jgi:hypothetical protein
MWWAESGTITWKADRSGIRRNIVLVPFFLVSIVNQLPIGALKEVFRSADR